MLAEPPDITVAPRNNTYTQECGIKAFAPGDILRDEVTWDETIYLDQHEGQIYTEPAQPGQYVWTVRLTAWFEHKCLDNEDDRGLVDLTFVVAI